MKADGYQMVENPVALAHEIDIRNKSSRMNFNANITYDILKQLQFKANLGTQYYTSRYNITVRVRWGKMAICQIQMPFKPV